VRAARRLVIDASVARAAGGEDAVHPLPKRCRDFLKTTLATGHLAVLTPPVSTEWKKHESAFARQWRFAMMARKRLLLVDPPEDGALRDALEDAAETERGRRAMLKDAHLVEAVRDTDRTVASLDDVVRGLFAAASGRIRVLRTIVWANPRHEAEGCTAWLEAGAPPEEHRQLRSWDPPR
jgi:hypothetical protein